MTSTDSTTLPAFVQAVIDAADETETFSIPEGIVGADPGIAVVVRQGAMNISIGVTSEEMRWHTHDSEDDARECYRHAVEDARSVHTFLTEGGDGRALALSRQTGMPLEMAVAILPQILAQMEGEPDIPVPAVGRAQVPQAVTVDLGPDDSWNGGGLYL